MFCTRLFYDFNDAAVRKTDGIGIIRVKMHLKTEGIAYTNLHVIEASATRSLRINGNVITVLDTEALTVPRFHMDMTVGNDAALLEGNDTLGTDDGDGGRARYFTRFSDGWLYL